MKLKLVREPSSADTTFGVLFINDLYFCLTLENSHKIIPEGNYPVIKFWSAHFQKYVPQLQNVLERTYIEMHPANYFYQLEGCIAVGIDLARPMLLKTDEAFEEFMKTLDFTNLIIEITHITSL